jgi:4-hydroxyphenylpyruvate dioxygenase
MPMSANVSDFSLNPGADPALTANPLGLAGLEFVEFAAPHPEKLGAMFESLGFVAVAQHVSKQVTLYRQGEMRFLINGEPDSFAERYAQEYGVSICALGLRVSSAKQAFKKALALGAWPFEGERVGPAELKLPAIQGIGDSHVYFVDRWPGRVAAPPNSGITTPAPAAAPTSTPTSAASPGGSSITTPTPVPPATSIYEVDFRPLNAEGAALTGTSAPALAADLDATLPLPRVGLHNVDHFTQTVGEGRMQEWLDFYRDLFNFREIHDLHPDWQIARSARVAVSPCGAIRIPLYEEGTHRTQVMHRFLPDHPGEGVQHIALASDNIFATVDALRARGIDLIEWPEAYYRQIDLRLPGHGLDVDALRRRNILVDGVIEPDGTPRLFLQAFIRHAPGEMFFEIVERRGHAGFGEGSLDALLRSCGETD